MKKLIAVTLLSISSIASASNWEYTSTDNRGETSYLDRSSFIWTDLQRKQRSAWVKIVRQDLSYRLDRVEIDCPTGMFRFIAEVQYNNQRFVLSSNYQKTEWYYSPPGSVAEYWVRTMCS